MKLSIHGLLLSATLVLSACGGGGGGGCDAQLIGGGAVNCGSSGGGSTGGDVVPSPVLGYTSAVSSGELVSNNWNTAMTQVNYGFIDWPASYSRDGQIHSVPVTFSSDEGTYAAPTFVSKYGKNSSGLNYGMISERYNALNSIATQLPFFGVLNLDTDPIKRQGIYNVIGNQCPTVSTCTPYYGTFRFNPDGTWDWCKSADLYTGSCAGVSTVSVSGSANTTANNGRITLTQNGSTVGQALFTMQNLNKVLVIQFNDSVTAIRNGMLVGVPRATLDASSIVGTWYFTSATQSGNWSVTNASTITETIDLSSPTNPSSTLNQPWAGLAKLDGNTPPQKVVLWSASGAYAYVDTVNKVFRVGLKKE